MISRCSILTLAVGLWACLAGHAAAQEAKDVVIEGQLKVGLHKIKMNAGTLYQVEVKGKNFMPQVTLTGRYVPNSADFFKEQNTYRGMFVPSQAQEHTLQVTLSTGSPAPEATLDYTLTLKTLPLNETPALKKEDKLTADDPIYQQSFRKTHFKVYPLTMKAGQTYVIDMIRSNPDTSKLDPYLYLESPMKAVVANDDDSAGNLNARILYRAPADGEYRIIASGLGNMSDQGDYTLLVRTVKGAK